ncbi:unnamed protein product [Ceratitis capitata]|uniref:(Mediterranean fruit fly) hypothetical protein n=1 Tax=Ceratitis capitata TaxID=7213 RepID=A0A811UVQ8_CERCA|nr:unnamed protein product [Ceratitis capitata]
MIVKPGKDAEISNGLSHSLSVRSNATRPNYCQRQRSSLTLIYIPVHGLQPSIHLVRRKYIPHRSEDTTTREKASMIKEVYEIVRRITQERALTEQARHYNLHTRQ